MALLLAAAPALAQGNLNLYCSVQIEWCQAIATNFQRDSGIRVNVTQRGSGETLAAIRAEGQNPRGDVWFGGTGDPHLAAAEENLTQAHESANNAQLQPWALTQWQQSGRRAAGVYAGVVGFGFNTELLARRNAAPPACWADLLDARFRGEIQVANPNSSGTAYVIIATLVQLMGEEPAFEFLRGLHPNVNSYARTGTGPIKAVARGETAISLSFVHDAVTERNAGFPVAYATPCEGTGFEIGSMSILRGARNISQARRFYDWALTAPAQRLGFEAGGQLQTPSNRDAPLPPTPTAFLVLIGVVEGISPAMEEASQTLRASEMRTFRAVSLPLMLPGIANAFLVVFVESLADFGNPIVLGGSFGVLSTEIFFAVVGAQQDFGRASVLASVMLVLALGAFMLQRAVVGRRSYVSMTGKGDVGLPTPLPAPVRRLAYAVALPWAALTIVVYAMALAGGFVRVWGRDWTPTLSHFQRAFALEWTEAGEVIFSGGAWHSLVTTITLAAVAAPITAGLGLLAAWILTRQKFAGRTALEFALMLTFAVPGTVIGVAYILTFNVPPLEITGTAMILIACFVFRNMPVGVRSGVAAMSQLDRSLDEAAITLRASTFRALRTVVLPLLKPAIVTALVYAFVRAMTTVSAVIFLVSAEYEMATVFIINRVINDDYGLAIAYCTVLIVLMMAVIGLINLAVGRRQLGRRAGAAA